MKIQTLIKFACLLASLACASITSLNLSARAGLESFWTTERRQSNAIPSNSSSTAEQTNAAVDTYIETERRLQQIPGLALAVLRDGQLIKSQGYGLANVELNVAVRPETIFQTGSMGKQFTATAIMMLVEDGKVALNNKLSTYLSDAPVAWQDVTVRNLLTHTSGIANYTDAEYTKPDGLINLRADYTEDELLRKLTTLPLNFQPGEKWSYSNTGYVLLGYIIHKITGEFFGDFLQERIFRPLGMASTRIISEADIIPNRSSGYQLLKGEIKNQKWVSPTFNMTADGSLYTNILDVAKWDAALYTEKLLKKSSLDQMWTPVTLSDGKQYPYGFGWGVEEVNGRRLIGHGGSWQGFSTNISRYVDDRLTVVVLTNLDARHSDARTLAHKVAGLYVPALKAVELKPIKDKEPQVTALVRNTLADLTAGHVNLDFFRPDQREMWIPERIEGMSEFLRSLGMLKSINLVERVEESAPRFYTYVAVFADRTMIVKLTLDREDKIIGFQIVSQ